MEPGKQVPFSNGNHFAKESVPLNVFLSSLGTWFKGITPHYNFSAMFIGLDDADGCVELLMQ